MRARRWARVEETYEADRNVRRVLKGVGPSGELRRPGTAAQYVSRSEEQCVVGTQCHGQESRDNVSGGDVYAGACARRSCAPAAAAELSKRPRRHCARAAQAQAGDHGAVDAVFESERV